MLKFRFRKKELRRRSNSCPNLESCTSTVSSDNGKDQRNAFINKHSSCYIEDKSDHESDNDVPSPTKRERLHAQKSIRRFKKKEKEQQENVEKNLLSVDDFWRKLDSLKEWLHDEQGNKEVDSMQSPKLRSHFKKFIKLWNKRKLPLKYYKNCCVDAEAESSSVEVPPNHHGNHSPSGQRPGQDPLTFDFLTHSKLRDLPSYHHFPFLDESSEQVLSPATSSVFSTLPVGFQDGSEKADDDRRDKSSNDSVFSTFGKSMCDPHTSTSFLAKQIDVNASKRKDLKLKIPDGPLSPTASRSPKKFATISRSTPASSMFKSSSPQVHAVVSPTCPPPPRPAVFNFSMPPKEQRGSDTDRDTKNPSPAYMCVQDAIPFDSNSPSPKYWQVGFGDVFEEDPESHYCSLSPFLKNKTSSIHNKAEEFSTRLPRHPSNLSRRRSKSMEDIYAVPSRLLMTMDIRKHITSPVQEDVSLTMPPIPLKKFTPTSSVVSLGGNVEARKQHASPGIESSESSDTLVSSSCEVENSSERPVLSMYSSKNSLPTDLGYHSGKFEGSQGNLSSILSTGIKSFSSLITRQSIAGVKRRSEEHETNVDEMESPKKTKPASSQLPSSGFNEVITQTVHVGKESVLIDDDTRSLTGSTKSHVAANLEKDRSPGLQQISKKSILTGSLNPTTRTPKMEGKSSDARDEKDRLSIIQIKVLDKSPTFPRRKVKRRSSSLVVTPGKGLTFGNKTNPRTAVSSPRRVSFAKNVKNGDDGKATTPLRKVSSASASRVSLKGSVPSRNISSQRQDKAEFEAFWARHDNQNTNSNNPVKDGGTNSKQTSPSKWLSPSKITTFLNPHGIPKQSHSHTVTVISNDEQHSSQGEERGSLIKSLSPKKLLTPFHIKSSSSSLQSIPASSSTTFPPTHEPCVSEPKLGGVITQPKSILRVKSTASSLVAPSTISTSKETAASSYQPHRQGSVESCSSWTVGGIGELNVDHCWSPPRLGVASLKAARFASTQNISSLPRSKQRLLFEAKMNQSAASSPEKSKSPNSSFALGFKSRHVLPQEGFPYVTAEKIDNNNINHPLYDEHNESIVDDKPLSDSFCEKLPPPPSYLLEENCGDNMTSHHSCHSRAIEGDPILSTRRRNEAAHNDTVEKISGVSDSDEMKYGRVADHRDTSSVTDSVIDVRHNKKCNIDVQTMPMRQNDSDVYSVCRMQHEPNDLPIDKDSQCVVVPPGDGDADAQLSRAVLERIQSFRSSPKVEENDGWITERRRSRGSKSKSFRNKLDYSPVQSQQSVLTPTFHLNKDAVSRDSLDASLTRQCDNNALATEFSTTNNASDFCLSISQETSHKTEQQEMETLSSSSVERFVIPAAHHDSVDMDKGYETESRSSKDGKWKCGGGGKSLLTDIENESVSSMTSSDSGNYGKCDTESTTTTSSSSSSCPIYDVPKTGIHVVKPMQDPNNPDVWPPLNLNAETATITGKAAEPIRTSKDDDNFIRCSNQIINDVEQSVLLQQNQIPSPAAVTTSGLSSQSSHASHMGDKENTGIPQKFIKPKPSIRPKPKPSPKPGAILQQSNASSLSPKVKCASNSSQLSVKRRSSIAKRDSMSVKNLYRPTISSSFKANCNNNTNTNTPTIRPVVRKRSSAANREDSSAKGKQPLAKLTPHTSSKIAPRKDDDNKRESITPSRRKRSSVERSGRRSSSGVSAGLEHSSFAQRKKFFQQLQQAASTSTSNGSSSLVVSKPKTSSVKISNSFLDKSRPKPSAKPVIKQKPEAS